MSTAASTRPARTDRDERMRDVSDKPGGRKGRVRLHRPRPIDAYKDAPNPARSALLAARIAKTPDSALAIRGAAVGRLYRKAAASANASTSTSPRVNTAGKTIEVWREFVQKRWNPEARFLNLERMGEDELLRKHNLTPPGVPGGSAKEAAVIFKLATQICQPELVTISLAHNNLRSGQLLSTLPHYLPKLANLSLEGNHLRSWKDLDYVAGRKEKLEHLRELILTGNPIREESIAKGDKDQYRNTVTRKFISLEMLDQEPITKIAFDAPGTSSQPQPAISSKVSTIFPCEMGPSLISGVPGAMLSTFLTRYFANFDNNRAALLAAYDPSATFSFSANTSIPPRARIQGFHYSKEMPNQKSLEWGPWLSGGNGGSRNLMRMGNTVEKTLKSLHVGAEETLKALLGLPATVHDIAGATDQFCVDAWPVGGDRLLVTVHGQLVESAVGGVRSFDRSFVVAPAPEGSRAKADGWEVVILSDQLLVRAYSSCEAWKQGPMRVQAGDPVPPIEQLTSIPEPQRTLVVQLSQQTRLTVDMSVDCLVNTGWDIKAALAKFHEVKATLPKEAYL